MSRCLYLRHASHISRTQSTIYILHLPPCRVASFSSSAARHPALPPPCHHHPLARTILRRTPGLRLASLPIPVASPVARCLLPSLDVFTHARLASTVFRPVVVSIHRNTTCHPLPQAPTPHAAAAHHGGQAARGARGKVLPPEVLDIPRRRAARSRCVELFFSSYLSTPSPSLCKSILRTAARVLRVESSCTSCPAYALIFEFIYTTAAATRVPKTEPGMRDGLQPRRISGPLGTLELLDFCSPTFLHI